MAKKLWKSIFMKTRLITLLAAFATTSISYGEEYQPVPVEGVEMECFNETSPAHWSYCINHVPESKNEDVLYYFHARNGNETWWNDRTYHTGKLYETWKELDKDAPTVVSISFGKLWLLTENPGDVEGGLFNILRGTVIPAIESKVSNLSGKRMIAGISMGGLNTLMLSMKSKGFFNKAASMCAPLATVSPHDSFLNIIRYYIDSSASMRRAYMLWKFSKQFYPTQEIWERNDPIFLSRSFKPEDAPEIYITCGAKDDWGCKKGSEIFVDNIEKAGGAIEWVRRPGGHCDIDYRSLALFLN